MQAILIADYSFTPLEHWRGVSNNAREFIKRCLTVDSRARMTSHQALQHPWIKGADPLSPVKPEGNQEDLLPVIKKNFNARRTLHKAIDTVRAINKLREGGGLMAGGGGIMDGAMSVDPKPRAEMVNGSQVTSGDVDGGQPMEGVAQGGQLDHTDGVDASKPGGDEMEIDSRGNGRGQTGDQILRQEHRIKETVTGLWSKR